VQAQQLPDAERANYLRNIRLHRDIVAAWAARPASEPRSGRPARSSM
jgi:hypothetical protein